METACKIPSSPEEHREMVEEFAQAMRESGWAADTYNSRFKDGSFVRLYMNGEVFAERTAAAALDIIQNAPVGVSPADWALYYLLK